MDNSFDEDESGESDSEDGLDEATRLAIKASEQQDKLDKKQRAKKFGHSEMGAMSETDGFKLAMQLSRKEAGLPDDESESESDEETTKGLDK